VKDRTKNTKEKDASCILGQGSIDYPKILKVAKKSGVHYFIVEQEKYEGTTPLKAVETDAAYMKGLSI
jgi:sugar phosphate isomerase/epimerase